MKRIRIHLAMIGCLAGLYGGPVAALQGANPEQIRDAHLALLDQLATLPIMTHDFTPVAEADAQAQTRAAALVQLQANLWEELSASEQALISYTNDELLDLQLQLQASGVDWRGLTELMKTAVTSDQLALLDPASPSNFPGNSCIGTAGITAAGVAKGVTLVARVIATQGCKAAQCGGPISVPPCIFAGVARGLFTVADAIYQGTLRCHEEAFENEGERRLGVKVTTRATETSVGIRNDCNPATAHCARTTSVACATDNDCDSFAALDVHEKLRTRLDVDLSTRATQDSIDGQREAPQAPSPEKSVRTVVDKTDQIVLPRIQRKMRELNAAIAAQGSLLRDLQLLQVRFEVSENLLQRHPHILPVVLFQLPDSITAPAKSFCSTSSAVSCLTDADCPPAIAGEECGPGTPPRTCSVSGVACTDFFDCPIQPQPAETCMPQANPQAGLLKVARDIVQETIDMNETADPRTGNSQLLHTRAVADLEAGNYKQAYRHLRQAYRRAIRPQRAP